MSPIDGKPAAYVCENFTCKAPVTDPRELAALLSCRASVPRRPWNGVSAMEPAEPFLRQIEVRESEWRD